MPSLFCLSFEGCINGRLAVLSGSLHRMGFGSPENDFFVLNLTADEPDLAWFWLEVRWDPMACPRSVAAVVEGCPVVVKGRMVPNALGNGCSRGFQVTSMADCGSGRAGLRISHVALPLSEFAVLVIFTGQSVLKALC